MVRKQIVLLTFFVGCWAGATAQNVAELEKRYGFKDIRLESIVDSVKGVKLVKEFLERNEFAAALYSVTHPDYSKIGEVKVNGIELKAYKSLIYEIRVKTEKDPRLMKALESLYGKADYDMKAETYFWKTDKLILKFRSSGKKELELIFTSFNVLKMMKDDKLKKVDDIANDF